ncbi:MAG TPA: cell wall-binding repeat-containing protein, partial [Thermoplasmata archaeon]|nr:cell wall-binding repeat-containing protein [Thermoplasmata archaeon]
MLKKIIPLAIVSLLLMPALAKEIEELPSGFEGVSWNKVVPLKKATFVKFDENSLIDDFAYISAIPASVFYDEKTGRMYSYPLLFYEDYKKGKEEELSLNSRQGLDYFMEDWVKYAGKLKEIEYINMNEKPWKADNYSVINSNDIYKISSDIALHDWSYSNSAVIAVVGNVNYGSYNRTEKELSGKISPKEIKELVLTGVKQDSIAPQYNDFYVSPEYKYIKADLYWPSKSWFPSFMFIATLGLLQGGLTIPSADPDLQLYCYDDENQLMEVASSENWNILVGPYEELGTYVYNPGRWKAAIVDIPTKGLAGERHGTVGQRIADILTGEVTYYINLKLYPGEEIELPNSPPFMTRNVDFELNWKGDGKLGLIIVDENNVAVGEAVATNVSKQKLHLDQLGEGKYKAVIIQLNESNSSISYTLKYSWECKLPEQQANYIMNAAEGAVLASLNNAPLLYVKPDKIPSEVENALKKLGVKKIYFMNIGGKSTVIKEELKSICEIRKEYISLLDVYADIKNITDENDIVFTTIDPWSYWLVEKLKPEGEKNGALYIAPAAYMAAHHGCPLIAVDMHPELSRAVVWHNEWWKKHAIRDEEPNVAAMYLTGKEVYNFLKENGLEKPGEIESLITVAGQFDIGTPWDRMFVGVAYPGRIIGTPVDTSYWICRSVFYPAVIFANPAVSKNGVKLINGSKSIRMPTGALNIIKPSQEEHFEYPVLNSWITYCHRFNERASKYWGFNYTCASGITPYYEPSTHPIDNNVLAKYGKYGSYWPDLTESEIVPFYL